METVFVPVAVIERFQLAWVNGAIYEQTKLNSFDLFGR